MPETKSWCWRKLVELSHRLQSADLVPSYPHSMTSTDSLGKLFQVRDVALTRKEVVMFRSSCENDGSAISFKSRILPGIWAMASPQRRNA
jgi:hypothetical protein